MSDPDQTRPTEGSTPTGRAKGPSKLGVYDRPPRPVWARPVPIMIAIGVVVLLLVLLWAFYASAGAAAVAAAALPSILPSMRTAPHGRQDHRRALRHLRRCAGGGARS